MSISLSPYAQVNRAVILTFSNMQHDARTSEEISFEGTLSQSSAVGWLSHTNETHGDEYSTCTVLL